MKEKLFERLYNYWKKEDEKYNTILKEQLTNAIFNDGKKGANTLLDWCRDDYDKCKYIYMEKHNLSEEEMEKILEEHYGDCTIIYQEMDFIEELDAIWDLCNWYLDFLNENIITEKWREEMI